MTRPSAATRCITVVAAGLCAAAFAPGTASAVEPGPAATLDSQSRPVAGGPGSQTDPHVSGGLVAYTVDDSASSEIRYADLAAGTAGEIPTAGHRDSLPDVSGDLIVFRRVFTDGSSASRPILVFDVSAPDLGTRELAPAADVRREGAAIGGTTVAFVQQSGASSAQTDVCVADAADPAAPATCLTTDGATASNRTPAVSPDGATVVFTKCLPTGLSCDIHVTRRDADGTWGAPVQLTGATGEEIQPDTDGSIVTYASNATGDFDVWWVNVDGTGADRIELTDAPGSDESNPNLSGGAITFERELPGDPAADLYLYRPAIGDLYRLTDTAEDETLNDVSLTSDGDLRVAWAQPDGVPGSNDVHALHARLPGGSAPDQPPVLTLPGGIVVDATGPDGAAVTYEATAIDEDGEVTVACSPAPGSVFAIGTTAVTCTATDGDGATVSGSFDVTVRGAREQLVDLLTAVAEAGPGSALATRISAVVNLLPDRALPLACRPLQLFIREVEAQSGRRIPADVAAEWIADATRIRAVLGCR